LTKREARRKAAFTVHLLIKDYLDAGQPHIGCLDELREGHRRQGERCPDCDNVRDTLDDYAEEFWRHS